MDKKPRKSSLIQAVSKQDSIPAESSRGRMKLRTRHKLDPKNPFKPAQVYKILEDIVTQGVCQFYYNPQEGPELCQELAAQIRNKIKAIGYDRYKLICVVEMAQKSLQTVESVCSFLWDPKRDHYTVFNYNKFDLIVSAYVFGVYLD